MEYDIEEGTVHAEGTIVVQETQFPELIHKVIDARSSGADHVREHGLIHVRNGGQRFSLLSKIRQEQEHSRQPFLA